jgi:GNAT superfamily N-acetyltransferase
LKIIKIIETDKTSYHIRTPCPADKGLITHSWVKSFWSAFEKTEARIGHKNFAESQSMLIRDLLSKDGSVVLVACDQFNSDIVFGYLVAEVTDSRLYIHWIYTKHLLRGYGIARALFEALIENFPNLRLIATHMTQNAVRPSKKKGYGIKYEPLLWDWKLHEQGYNETRRGKLLSPGVCGGTGDVEGGGG